MMKINSTHLNCRSSKHFGHVHADYLEVYALWSPAKEYSFDDFDDRIEDTKDLVLDEEIDAPSQPTITDLQSAKDVRMNGYFEICKTRANKYGDKYPFEVTKTMGGKPMLRVKDRHEEHYPYLFCLMLSLGGVLEDLDNHRKSFEKASLCWAKRSFNDFEFNQLIINQSTTKRAKLESIAETLGVDVNSVNMTSTVYEQKSGDGGIDFYGYHKSLHGNANNVFVFGQSKTGINWDDDLAQLSISKLRQLFNFTLNPICVWVISTCYRNSSFHWFDPIKASDILLIDRFRFVSAFDVKSLQRCGSDQDLGLFDFQEGVSLFLSLKID